MSTHASHVLHTLPHLVITYLDAHDTVRLCTAIRLACADPRIDWRACMYNDTRFLTDQTRAALRRRCDDNIGSDDTPRACTVHDVRALYTPAVQRHLTTPWHQPSHTCALPSCVIHTDAHAYTVAQPRGVLVAHEDALHWYDGWCDPPTHDNTCTPPPAPTVATAAATTVQVHPTLTISCTFLNRLPWQLDATYTMHAPWLTVGAPWLPHDVSKVVAASGSPEDVFVQTNHRQYYRVQVAQNVVACAPTVSHVRATADDDSRHTVLPNVRATEVLLGGAFEATVTHLQLSHYVYPFVVVSGFPTTAAAPMSLCRHFGVWDVQRKRSVLAELVPPVQKWTTVAVRCATPNARGFWRYECLCADDDTGRTLYWVYRGALASLHLPTGETTCVMDFPAFANVRVTRISVCRLKRVIGVYDGDAHVWCVHDLDTGTHLLHTFGNDFRKTQLTFQPFLSQCWLTRRIGTKVWRRVVPWT